METIIKKNEIEFLVHFTRCSNLKNIFKYGLIPRAKLDSEKIESTYNDNFRYDGHEEATCASISFPNYKMFWGLRRDYEEEDWAVLGINARVLSELNCAFCIDNAASIIERNRPINEKIGKEALSRLYDEYPGQVSRVFLGISKEMTTNPQSEVLIFDNIDVNHIFGVAFVSNEIKEKYEDVLPSDISVVIDDYLFKWRVDYQYWKKE